MKSPSELCKTGALVSAVALTACGGETHGPAFQPIEGVTGKLAYISTVTRSGQIEYQLRSLDLETGSIRTIYSAPTNEQIWTLSWRPDGQALAMTIRSLNVTTDAFSLRRVNEDGSGITSLFNGTGPESGTAYSEGGALAYCGGFSPDAALFVDGAPVYSTDCVGNASPAWFPDGSAVAMVAYVGGALGLYRVDLATHTAASIVATPPPGNAATAAVSPQGDVVAVPVADAEGWRLRLINLDGGGSTDLPGGSDAYDPQWSADASRILFVRGFRPYVHELATGTVTRIIDTEMISIAWYR